MKRKNQHPVMTALLWICFLAVVAVVVYLSFQNGEQSKALGEKFIIRLAQQRYPGREATTQEILELTYEVRQLGRIGAFFVIGILGTAAIHISCGKRNWLVKTGITASMLVAIACFTERLKIYIPTRHYSYEEMMLSIVSVIMGFMLVSVVTLTFQALKGFFRLVTAVH